MYRKQKPTETTIRTNFSVEGESIETKMQRIMTANEPITDGAEMIYTERKNGVDPACDPRTDKFVIAVESMEKVHQTKQGLIKKKMEDREAKKIAEEARKNMKTEGENNPGDN